MSAQAKCAFTRFVHSYALHDHRNFVPVIWNNDGTQDTEKEKHELNQNSGGFLGSSLEVSQPGRYL
jgi:hypothetical protein